MPLKYSNSIKIAPAAILLALLALVPNGIAQADAASGVVTKLQVYDDKARVAVSGSSFSCGTHTSSYAVIAAADMQKMMPIVLSAMMSGRELSIHAYGDANHVIDGECEVYKLVLTQ